MADNQFTDDVVMFNDVPVDFSSGKEFQQYFDSTGTQLRIDDSAGTELLSLSTGGNLEVPGDLTAGDDLFVDGGIARFGIEDSVRAQLLVFGSSGTDAGIVRIYNGTGSGGTVDYWKMTNTSTGGFIVQNNASQSAFGATLSRDTQVYNDLDVDGIITAGSAPTTLTNTSGTIKLSAIEEDLTPSFSSLWFHAGDSAAHLEAVSNDTWTKMTAFNTNYGHVGKEDSHTNVVGSSTGNEMVIGTSGGGMFSAEISVSFGSSGSNMVYWTGIAKDFATGVPITTSTDTTPIVVSADHGLQSGDGVIISGHLTNINVNGSWLANVLTTGTFELIDFDGTDSTGSGAGAGSSGNVDTEINGGLIAHRSVGIGTDVGSATVTGKISAAVNDSIYGVILNHTSGAGMTIQQASIGIERLEKA